MATSDDLPLQDTDAVNTSLSSVPLQPDESSQTLDNQRHDDFSLSRDHPDPTSESSGLTPLPCQDETIEVLMQPLGQTALLGITRNHPGTDEGDNRDFDTFAIMENDDITNKNSNFDLLYQTSQSPVEMDNMLDINQKETNINEVPDEVDRNFDPLSLYSHFPSLTEHLRPSEQEEMSTTLKQYTSSASLELPINQKSVDAEIPLINTDIKSDKMNTEQIPNQPLLIADDAADSYFSSTVPSQTSQDLLSGADLGKSINITYPEMHDIAEDMPDVSSFTTALDPQTPWIPKIEDPQTGDLLSLADLQKADTLNILTVFTQASSLADSVETKNNVWETADVPVTDSSITQTLNNTTTDSLGASTVDCCISVLTQAPQDLVKEVKLDVQELEPCKMVDSVIDRVFDRTFPMQINREVPVTDLSNDPPMDSVTVKNSDTLFQSIHSLPYSISDTPQICERDESNLSEIIDWYIPFASKDLCDSSEVTEGVTLNFKGTERDGEACNELWLDACQFLAGEEDEGAIFDEWGRSRSPSPPTTHPDNTKASDFPRRENTAIDHQAENLERTFPPVERWSSTDSWASALSDWIQIVNIHPEEYFTSTNTSGTDLKFSMAIQDPALEQGTTPNITNNTGKTCLSLNLLEPEVDEALGRGLAKSDNTNGPQFEEGDKHRLPSHPDLDKQKNATIENKVNLSETLSESKSDFPEMNAGMDSFNAVSCVHAGNEVNAKSYGHQHITGELWSSELERNVLAEVTGDGLIFKEERESSSHSLKISAYTGEKSLTAECVSAEEQSHGSFSGLHTCPPHSNNHVSSEAEHTCSFAEKNASCMSSNKEELTVNQGKENNTIPQPFIMPFAPLCIGNTFHQHSALSKESRQGNVDLPLKGTESQKPISSDGSSEEHFHTCPEQYLSSSSGESDDLSIKDTKKKTESSKSLGISQELSKLLLVTGERFIVSQDKHVAYITLDLDEPRDLTLNHLSSFSNHINSETQHCSCETQPKTVNMPHKTSKASSDSKTRSKHKEKSADQQHGIQTSKKQENLHPPSQTKGELNSGEAECEDRAVTVIETIVITEKITPKAHGKKKKKHSQHGTAKPENDPSAAVGNKIIQSIKNGKTETLEAKTKTNGTDKPASQLLSKMDLVSTSSTQKVIPVKPKAEARGNIVAKIEHDNMDTTEKTIPVKLKTETSLNIVSKMNHTSANATQITTPVKLKLDPSGSNKAKMESKTCSPDPQSTCLPSTPNDDIKRRRIANDVPGAVPIRTRPQLPAIFRQVRKDGDDISRRAYSEVVKQKAPPPKEVLVPRVVSEIQADPVPNDPQNIILWCRFNPVPPDATIKWTKEGSVLSESRKREEDEGRFTLTILKACSKDLGLYKCSLTTASLSVSTSEYHLTSEVLMELVIPSHDAPVEPRPVDGEEESVQCSPLLFREDFLSDQYFGENQPASIVTEQAHFGEGMHRKAFRTTLRTGKLPRFNPGHPCVLKVHNAIGYGTKNNEELVQKNYSLAVEECHVQNTAREYIKAYHSVAKSAESFGEVPEIIPIYLVHRPSNNIPYATLEEELLGDFVKYSVKDGKEINLMRRDSEAGQKCCAFQHWVYTQTEGNLLVTDMQGVGMKLTDVGIATCKKGYKGFRGNCATSFIDQFKALHQCNRYCELLDLTSLQPKPKRTVAPPKPKAQPVPKKKTFGPVLNGKS